MAVAICDVPGGPRPTKGETLDGFLDSHLNGNYGVMMYYCLRSRDEIKTAFTGHFAGSSNPEDYFSIISNKLHGENTVYVGEDYPRIWYGGAID